MKLIFSIKICIKWWVLSPSFLDPHLGPVGDRSGEALEDFEQRCGDHLLVPFKHTTVA